MTEFKEGVPFDPGYSRYGLYFPVAISPFYKEYVALKSPHQKKFKLNINESHICSLLDDSTAFYLGCILWGAFVHYRFKDDPRKITDNPMKKLSEEELNSRNYSEEIDFILQFIQRMERDYKYFLNKTFKVNPQTMAVFEAYKEFASLNDNFRDIETTDDVKLPKAFEHFKKHSIDKLDALYKEIMNVVETGKFKELLKIGFYE